MVLSVDRSAGVIVVGDMGPWRIKDGVTQVDRRRIEVMPATEFVRVRRAKADDGRLTAIRISVWEPTEG